MKDYKTNHYLPLLLLLTVTEYLYKEGVNKNRYLPLLNICKEEGVNEKERMNKT